MNARKTKCGLLQIKTQKLQYRVAIVLSNNDTNEREY